MINRWYTVIRTNVSPHFDQRRFQMVMAHVINLIDVASPVPRAPAHVEHACTAAHDICA